MRTTAGPARAFWVQRRRSARHSSFEFDYISTEGNPHRSEAAAMLTAMGQSPGDIDLIVFLNEGSPTK